jgi:hypothetical protein
MLLSASTVIAVEYACHREYTEINVRLYLVSSITLT